MPHICFYISGHGYGHGTRAAQLIIGLLQSNVQNKITICTKAPRHLFPFSDRLIIREREVDSAIVQPLPYDIDVLATFEDLLRFADRDDRQAWLTEELAFLSTRSFDVILSDAAWIIGQLDSAEDRIPARIIVSNFTFDLVFRDLLQHLPNTCSADKRVCYEKSIDLLIQSYQSFEYLIRLPGYIDFPFVDEATKNKTKVLDAALIYRPPASPRATTLSKLQIPFHLHNHKILLVQFGGHATSAASSVPELPPGWICLMSTPVDHASFFTFPADIFLPDLVEASELVLGKIGYGTVSESVGMAKPLLYVRREMFAEEPYLLRYMRSEGTCLEMSRGDFEAGRWSDSIDLVMSQHAGRRHKEGISDGSKDVAKMIDDIILDLQ